MGGFDFTTLGALLLVASLVAVISRRINLPYSVGLVAAGIGLALLPVDVPLPLTPDLIFFVFLPPLVFEAAIQLPWKPLWREAPLLFALVTVGVALAALVVAAGMHFAMGWSWIGAGLFGVLIAATAPVAVIAAFKQLKVDPRLHLLVESESLLNDGVAAVGFAILVAIAAGEAAGPLAISFRLVQTVLGGVLAGGVVAVPLVLLAGRTHDRLVETTLTMVIAYGSFLLAEHFHCSGVLATLTAGLIVGNFGFMGSIAAGSRQAILDHWEYVAFFVNSLIFILIGGGVAAVPFLEVIEVAGLAILLAIIGRAVTVYPVTMAFRGTRLAVPWRYKHALFWGGLRGALALALALGLPASIPERNIIIAVSFAVVAFSIFVQGITMPWLIDRLGLIARDGEASGQ